MDRWKSPIDLRMFEESFATKILEDQTGCVVETCVKMGVDVDKEELLKALAYDRHQYEQGYSDGIRARDEEIVRCKDCKNFRQHSIEDIKRCGFKHDGMCVYWNSHSTNFEWFCINGERKETEDE